MIILSTDRLEVVTGTSEALHVVASWADVDKTGATAYTPGASDTTIASATTTTIVDAPASATIYRTLTGLSIVNAGAASNTVTVRKVTSGPTLTVHAAVALAAGEALRYEDGAGWDRYTATGERMTSGRDGVDGATGPAGVGTSGTATIDFGSWPGNAHATVDVTGQATITGTSRTEAWILPAATADHTADEHLVEAIRIVAGPATAGVGFTIHASMLDRPGPARDLLPFRMPGGLGRSRPIPTSPLKRARVYGQWSVAWRWS